MTAPRCVSGSALKATLSATIAEGARGQVSPFFLIETFLIIIHHTPPHDHHSPPHDDDDDDDDDYDDDYDDDCTSVKMKPLPARLLGAPYSPGVSLAGTENYSSDYVRKVTIASWPFLSDRQP